MEAYYECIQIANNLLLESKAYSYNGMKCDRFHRRTQLCVPNLINPQMCRCCIVSCVSDDQSCASWWCWWWTSCRPSGRVCASLEQTPNQWHLINVCRWWPDLVIGFFWLIPIVAPCNMESHETISLVHRWSQPMNCVQPVWGSTLIYLSSVISLILCRGWGFRPWTTS